MATERDPARSAARDRDYATRNRRERFWLRVVSFAVKRANKAGGPHRGMPKYHWTRPAPPDCGIYVEGNDVFGI